MCFNKWIIKVYIGSVSGFVKFWGKTSNNVNDVWKVCLETTLYVYVCFIEYYLFILEEIDIVGPKLV